MSVPRMSLVPRRAVLGISAAAGMAACARTASTQPMGAQAAGRVVLLGDSVFDNAGYLRGSVPALSRMPGRQRSPGSQAVRTAIPSRIASTRPSR